MSSLAAPVQPLRSPVRHGTLGGYTNRGCRCEECRGAHSDYQRKRRRGKSGTRSATALMKKRDSVLALRRQRLSITKIAIELDLSTLQVRACLYPVER